MNKHEIIVRGALRLYDVVYTSAYDVAVFHYYCAGGTDTDLKRGTLAAKAKAIIAHDQYLTRLSK